MVVHMNMFAIYNSRNLYGQFDKIKDLNEEKSTTVEIYMVNSTILLI